MHALRAADVAPYAEVAYVRYDFELDKFAYFEKGKTLIDFILKFAPLPRPVRDR